MKLMPLNVTYNKKLVTFNCSSISYPSIHGVSIERSIFERKSSIEFDHSEFTLIIFPMKMSLHCLPRKKAFLSTEQLQVLIIGIVSIIFMYHGKIVPKCSIYSFRFQHMLDFPGLSLPQT